MADHQTEEVKLVKIAPRDSETTHAGEDQPVGEKKFHKYDSKWEIIDKIKASDEQAVVINIFKVHPEATWKEIKSAYAEFHMKIEKVPTKEGMFNLHFNNHNDAINFIKVSPKPILDKKFTMRLNERIKPNTSGGWNEMGADGHTAKFETMKYYKNKSQTKKPFTKRTEDGEATEEVVEKPVEVEGAQEEEGLDLPTRQIAEKPANKVSNEQSHKRFIGSRDTTDHGFGNRNKDQKPREFREPREPREFREPREPREPRGPRENATETKSASEKPVVVQAATTKPAADDWNTVKDVVKEKKNAEEAKKKAEKVQKEKEQQEKKTQETKAAQAEKTTTATKKPVSNFADGW